MKPIELYSLWDKKGKRYDTPFFCFNPLFAKRHFTILSRNKQTMVAQFPEDFRLDKIGELDLETGELKTDIVKILDGSKLEMED